MRDVADTNSAGPSSTSTSSNKALQALRQLVDNDNAQFHSGQYEAISALVNDRKRALVVQRTGWGKSAVYFVATLLLRESGSGPTVLISPLLALMRDQVEAAQRAGVRAMAINSANMHQWDEIISALDKDEIDLLLISPERLNNPVFRATQLPELIDRIGLLVVDEAHCISDWGHDFRPDYRRLRDLIAKMPSGVPVLATTATANSRVVTDIAEQVGMNEYGAPLEVLTIRGPLARKSLRLGVLTLPDSQARLAWLLTHLGDLSGSGIIYALTVSAAEDTAKLLRKAGHEVYSYTGKTDSNEREELEIQLKENRVKALVATSALGMGFDKPDLGFVIHLGAPSSPVAYYQQVGRAGRATSSADVLLLPGTEDQAIWEYFATTSMPDEQRANTIIAALNESSVPLSTPTLETIVDLRRTQLELLLKVLDVEGIVSRVKGGWVATGSSWSYDKTRYERIAASRIAEQQAMLDYEVTNGCRMEFLQQALDDPSAAPCGRCDRCVGPWFSDSVDGQAQQTAKISLAKAGVAVEPRAQWPTAMGKLGVLESKGKPLRGKIPVDKRMDEGRALARLTDLGWGNTLRSLLATNVPDTPIDKNLLKACISVLADWEWDERPRAIVSVPSRSHSQLVSSLATQLAQVGQLPYLGELFLVGGGPSGVAGGNSAFRLAAVWECFSVDDQLADSIGQFQGGPILLVDDFAESRWTLTVCAAKLREAGAVSVMPFVLALK